VEETLNQEQKHKQELQKTNKRLVTLTHTHSVFILLDDDDDDNCGGDEDGVGVQEQEARELHVRLEELQQEEQKLRRDADRLREQLHKLQAESHDTRTHTQELQQQLAHATQQLHTHTVRCAGTRVIGHLTVRVLALQDQVKQEAAAREEAENRTRQIQEELEQIRRERDTLR
ncbi:hypothetical protein M9458_054710, partial [Cirrhinus mrigala]